MFHGNARIEGFEISTNDLSSNVLDVELVIQECRELPEIVRSVKIDRTYRRLMDHGELDRVSDPGSIDTDDADSADRLLRRRRILQRYLGCDLVCAIIRLPGVFYTVEINVDTRSVVHWEWQDLVNS